MTDRTVKVTLRAQVEQYLDGMERAAKKTRETGSEAEKLAQKREAFDMLGKSSLAMGAAIAAGLVLAVAKYAEFDQAMSNVQAATHASAEDQKALSDAALEAGASTVFSATQSANAIEELSKAGLSTADILGGALTGSLDLASAGELGVARAAEIASTTLQQFKLDGSQAGHVADVLAAGAGKAMGSVEDLAAGLKFVGPVANAMNVSLEETTGVLALFAQQGIIGEQAGTSLRGVLASLTSPSKLARKEIERLGLEIYDADGKFLGLENAAGQLAGAYRGMDDASRDASLGVIFGRETITAATTLYQAGAEGVAEWTQAVDDSGYAAITAQTRLDNLKGDIEALGGAFDTALIQTGSAGNDSLRAMTQTLTNVIDLYNAAPEPVKITTLAVAGIAAATALAGGAFFLATPKVAAFNTALATMGPTAQKAGTLLTASAGPIGIAFAAAGLAVAIFAGRQAEAQAQAQSYADTLEDSSARVTEATRKLAVQNLQAAPDFWDRLFVNSARTESVYDSVTKLGLGFDIVTDAAMGNAEAMAELGAYLNRIETDTAFAEEEAERLGMSYGELQSAAENTAIGVGLEADALKAATELTKQKRQADKEAVEAAEEHEGALGDLLGKAEGAENAIEDLADTIRGFGDATLDVREANRNLEDAYDSLTESVKENGTTLDIAEEKGRANEAALDAIAQAAKEAAAATYEQTGSQTEATAVMEAGRAKLIEMLAQFGITGEAADAYADELGLIPGNVSTAVVLNTTEADAALRRWVTNSNGIKLEVVPVVGGRPINAGQYASGAIVDYYANGGTRENHVAQIAPAGAWRVWAEPETGGEAYIPFAMSKRARSLEIWKQTGARLGVRGFADGAVVQYAPARSYATAPSAAASAPAGPLRIEGRMDLGNGLTGYVRGVITEQLDDVYLDALGGTNR